MPFADTQYVVKLRRCASIMHSLASVEVPAIKRDGGTDTAGAKAQALRHRTLQITTRRRRESIVIDVVCRLSLSFHRTRSRTERKWTWFQQERKFQQERNKKGPGFKRTEQKKDLVAKKKEQKKDLVAKRMEQKWTWLQKNA